MHMVPIYVFLYAQEMYIGKSILLFFFFFLCILYLQKALNQMDKILAL